jgi:hypothetical protein
VTLRLYLVNSAMHKCFNTAEIFNLAVLDIFRVTGLSSPSMRMR